MNDYMINVSVIVRAETWEDAEYIVSETLNWQLPEFDILEVVELD